MGEYDFRLPRLWLSPASPSAALPKGRSLMPHPVASLQSRSPTGEPVGVSVSCPALKGCHSQRQTKEEALENIRDAIREWLDAEGAESRFLWA
jgi:hypothetical protein